MRYKTIVTRKRVILLAVFLWAFGGLLVSVRLFSPNVPIFLGVGAATYVICLVGLVVSYWKTYSALKRHQLQISRRIQTSYDLTNVLRYKRSLNTVLFIVDLVLFCYLPYIVLALIVVGGGRTVVERTAWTVVDTIMFLNSLLNPIMYCWRIREIRRVVHHFILGLISKCCNKSRRKVHITIYYTNPTDPQTNGVELGSNERRTPTHYSKATFESKNLLGPKTVLKLRVHPFSSRLHSSPIPSSLSSSHSSLPPSTRSSSPLTSLTSPIIPKPSPTAPPESHTACSHLLAKL